MAEQLANNLWRLEIPLVGNPLKALNSSLQESATFSSIRGSMKKHVERPWWKNWTLSAWTLRGRISF